MSMQPDGKILVGGLLKLPGSLSFDFILRLNSDGTRDMTFIPDLNSTPNIIILQPDGKILLAGKFDPLSGPPRMIVRLNADGSLDSSFDSDVNQLNPKTPHSVNAIALQPDGRIVIAGYFGLVNGVVRENIARLNADGSLDPDFNPGLVTENMVNPVNALVLQPDGSILVGGSFSSLGGMTAPILGDWTVMAILIRPSSRRLVGRFSPWLSSRMARSWWVAALVLWVE